MLLTRARLRSRNCHEQLFKLTPLLAQARLWLRMLLLLILASYGFTTILPSTARVRKAAKARGASANGTVS